MSSNIDRYMKFFKNHFSTNMEYFLLRGITVIYLSIYATPPSVLYSYYIDRYMIYYIDLYMKVIVFEKKHISINIWCHISGNILQVQYRPINGSIFRSYMFSYIGRYKTFTYIAQYKPTSLKSLKSYIYRSIYASAAYIDPYM